VCKSAASDGGTEMTEIWEIKEVTDEIKLHPYTEGNTVFILMMLFVLTFFAGMMFAIMVMIL
jgi:hypothetical protein